jgi:hypothetical protein
MYKIEEFLNLRRPTMKKTTTAPVKLGGGLSFADLA